MDLEELKATARALVGIGKGILAADESTPSIARRLERIGTQNTVENRRAWRQLLFTTGGIQEFISGIILFDETIRQSTDEGLAFVEVLKRAGIIPGIKVDRGTKTLAFSSQELVTEGLDGLGQRLQEYRQMGARFAKWRAVITVGDHIPTPYCIDVNGHALARYAALSQEAGLVPIVEPEVLMDGGHSVERCFEVTEATLASVFTELRKQHVALEGMLLKPNMVLSGKEATSRAGPERVAEATVRCFQRSVPAVVPGIVFLSGGQTDEEATLNLNSINQHPGPMPWQMSFSYGRGLQSAPLGVWGGEGANVGAAQAAFFHRCCVTSAARRGKYTLHMETEQN